MKEEIFGPVLPIISYQSIDEAIYKHILKKGKPLAIYFFGNIFNNQNYKDILEKTSSGNVTANDILSQTVAIDLGFGGVGGSGMGRYGGYEGFKNWSN
jgi:acyl-CoA reductase-like NAD-dependent aldehyde dehydrogenase